MRHRLSGRMFFSTLSTSRHVSDTRSPSRFTRWPARPGTHDTAAHEKTARVV